MKNILSTLAVLTLFCASAVGALILYQRAFDTEGEGFRELKPEEAASEIAVRLGQPFIDAWAARDVEALKDLTRGEFGAGLPTPIDWTIENNPPFETKHRSCIEEEQDSTSDYDVLFGELLDPIAGLKNLQTEFSVLKAMYYSRKNGDMYHCDLLLRATGIDENGFLSTFSSEQEVLVILPNRNSAIPASYRSWRIHDEQLRNSTEPVADQIYELLSKRGIENASQAEFEFDVADIDGDDDLDIALTMSNGKRFVFAFGEQGYKDVTDSLGIQSDQGQPSGQGSMRTIWADFDEDGFPDLVSGNRVYENEKGTQFVDVTERVGLEELMGPAAIDSMGRVRRHFRAQ